MNSPIPAAPSNPDEQWSRQLIEARYRLFDRFVLDDQRQFYDMKVRQHRKAANEVNFLRATMALLTIVSTAVATFIVQTTFLNQGQCVEGSIAADAVGACNNWRGFVSLLFVLSILFPALGAFFNMLADLFQWDRLVRIYDEAKKSLEIPDAISPKTQEDDIEFTTSLLAYAKGTLDVMRDESAQWGQLIRKPESIEQFRRDADSYVNRIINERLGRSEAPASPEAPPSPPPIPPTDAG